MIRADEPRKPARVLERSSLSLTTMSCMASDTAPDTAPDMAPVHDDVGPSAVFSLAFSPAFGEPESVEEVELPPVVADTRNRYKPS